MRCLISRICLAGLALVLMLSAAFAQCTEDRRQVDLVDVVQLRTYVCRTGQGAEEATARVEIHRLSDLAASIILANRKSEMLARVIGSPRLINNEVSTTYSNLLRQFGTTVSWSKLSLKVEGAGAGGSGGTSGEKAEDGIRVLSVPDFLAYPAIEEIEALRRKMIPSGLRHTYVIVCQDTEPDTDS